MKHISIRLPWHDRGWDGCVCDKPSKNIYCKGFHSVNADRIRREKNDKKENLISGQAFDAKWNYHPPCAETINVFGNATVQHTHTPKSFIKNTSSKTVSIPPNTSGTWAFEDMWESDGERREADERKGYSERFFDELKEGGNAGLIFYYCNYDNPVSGNDKKYLLAGIARVHKIHPFTFWDDIPDDQKEKYGGYIWSRMVENNPLERIRLPYQEYIALNKDVQSIAVFAEGAISRSFKYVAHHVSDDDAISLIDKAIVSAKTVISHKYLPTEDIGKWEENLEWLKGIRKECWISRGLYPGLGSVLKFLGMEKPEEYIRIKLKDLAITEIKDYFFDRFEGYETISHDDKQLLGIAKDRYLAMLHPDNENEAIKAKLCRDKLPFFDLDDSQIKNILDDKRGMYSIHSSLASIYENPYIIAEEYIGRDYTDFVNFEKIDHGMLPSEDLGEVERIRLDDWRRLRCLMFTILTESAVAGHTFVEWIDLSEKVNVWHELNDKAEIFNCDLTTWNQYRAEFAPKLVEDRAEGIHAIYIKRLHDAERILAKEFSTLIKDTPIDSAETDWGKLVRMNNTEPNDEQIVALEKLYTSRLGVLTGTAGTGKTTVIQSLIQGVKEKEPNHDFLLLAPTGKAAIILKERINDSSIKVLTIHSFLMRKGWVNRSNFTLKLSGDGRQQASTVIIDECSMIDTMLFATTIRALDMSNIERLVLVGDYNQLPPIGPGKVFYDLISYMKKDEVRAKMHLAELQYNWRQSKGSKAALLSNHFARIAEVPDEEIFKDIESNVHSINNPNNNSDLIIDIWQDEEDLFARLPQILDVAISKLEKSNNGTALGKRYDDIHGIPFAKEKNIEAINIIAPYRHKPSGVDNLNLEIQKVLRGKDTVDKWSIYGYVFSDKVLQVRNYTYKALDHPKGEFLKTDENYIPNGTLGYFSGNKKRKLQIKFPKDYERYSYYPSKKQTSEMLELGYATSVHKAQGSQFSVTIIVLPNEDVDFLNREMLYTALTRSTEVQILLIQNDISILKSRLWLGYSDMVKRNSSLFTKSRGIPSKDFDKFKPENLIYEALPDLFVRSRGELMISKSLAKHGVGFYYEKPLLAADNKSFKLPDFTFKHKRKTYYWEHNGMLNNFDYKERAEKKRRWYTENGYQDTLIETPFEGMNLNESIKYVFENILCIELVD